MKKGDRLLCPLPDALDLKHNGGRGQSGLSPFFLSFSEPWQGFPHSGLAPSCRIDSLPFR
jgi:hypothetical protein